MPSCNASMHWRRLFSYFRPPSPCVSAILAVVHIDCTVQTQVTKLLGADLNFWNMYQAWKVAKRKLIKKYIGFWGLVWTLEEGERTLIFPAVIIKSFSTPSCQGCQDPFVFLSGYFKKLLRQGSFAPVGETLDLSNYIITSVVCRGGGCYACTKMSSTSWAGGGGGIVWPGYIVLDGLWPKTQRHLICLPR